MKNIWFGFLAFLFLAGCKDLEEINEITVNGTVLDATTKAPLDSVLVSLYEDNDGAFMGKHLLQEITTNASGTFKFNFTYKEGPYTIFVSRRGYGYSRLVKDKILGLETTVNYQSVEGLKNEQQMTFEMFPVAEVIIKVKNAAPARPDDQIDISVGRPFNGQNPAPRTYVGITDLEFSIGNMNVSQYIPVNYSVRENNVWRNVEDSVLVQKNQVNIFNLTY